MVVLAMAICTKTGKPLLSRQYVDMTRIRIEGILAAFPKLIGYNSDSDAGRQHTFVETDTVRYVYQPIETMNILVVTTKGSNIIQDLETLRLLSKIIPDYCVPITEEAISEHVFELVFAFDEVITLGYKEDITLAQIRTNVEMESHEEKLHMMVRASKENEARDEGRRKAAAIRAAQREEMVAQGGMGNRGGMGSQGFGNTPSTGFGGGSQSGFGSNSSGFGAPPVSTPSTYGQESNAAKKPTIGGGMKLGKGLSLKKKGGKNSLMSQMAEEEGIDAEILEQQKETTNAMSAPGAIEHRENVEVRIVENVAVRVADDGAVLECVVRGELQVTCTEDDTKIKLHLAQQDRKPIGPFKLRPHPQVSKPDFQNGILQMRQVDRPFPRNLGLLKWEMKTTDENLLPLRVTVWPESSGSQMNVNVEYSLCTDLDIALNDVVLHIPLPSGQTPMQISSEGGVYRHNSRRQRLEWEITTVDSSNSTGILEFEIESRDKSDFFPVAISFSSEETMYPVGISGITNVTDEEQRKFGFSKKLTVDTYEIVCEE